MKDGAIDAVVHESLQDADFRPLRPTAPAFRRFDGQVIPYGGSEIVYPALINEAAYYEQGIAFFTSTRETRAL
jgi:aspartoacylase